MSGKTITCAMCGRQRSDDKYWIHDGRDFCTKKCTYAWDRKKEAEKAVTGRTLVVSRCLPPGDGRCLCCGFTGRAKDRACVKHGEEYCRRCAGECGAQKRARERQQGGMMEKQDQTLAEVFETVDLSPEGIRTRLQSHAATVRTEFERGVSAFIRIGDELTAAKDLIAHGAWSQWVSEELPFGDRTARQFIQIARDPNIRRFVEERQRVAVLPPDRLILTELCGLPDAEFDQHVETGVIHAEMKRGDVRRARVVADHQEPDRPAAGAVPEGKFGAILADPPWKFETMGSGGLGRSAENHYPTMTKAEIVGLLVDGRTVADLAADDSVLFLWISSSMIPGALDVMQGWGFTCKTTAFVWAKDGPPGLGYWTRKGSEICLLGTRGNPKRLNADIPEVIYAPRFEHSVKPKAVYERIERLVNGPYIELFARHNRDGWTSWGNHPGLEN